MGESFLVSIMSLYLCWYCLLGPYVRFTYSCPTSSPDSAPATDCYDLSNFKPFKLNTNVCKKVYIFAVYIRCTEYSFGLCSVATHYFVSHWWGKEILWSEVFLDRDGLLQLLKLKTAFPTICIYFNSVLQISFCPSVSLLMLHWYKRTVVTLM